MPSVQFQKIHLVKLLTVAVNWKSGL